ncbi:MAG: RnfABCDGE type electron transport complex subunit D [Saccharospirillaceae bacterium]|nr:RnfABCDGE type electron transport complex subunit D [Pseudomonadales bacterium]NRB79983.1 RnfABCDGE type electron transport complex subunit D [Saccharospirillaceae bacterium]
MAFVNITSPHVVGHNSVTLMMGKVCLALVPALVALTYFFGWGYVINAVLAVSAAVFFEVIITLLRKRPILFAIKDLSAVTTALLLALAVPPFLPWWATIIGIFFAIVFIKHLFGGLGHNPFNPAMAAYALLLISFPLQMTTTWSIALTETQSLLSFGDTLTAIFKSSNIDSYTGATVLDVYKHNVAALTQNEITQNPIFGSFVANGWEWVSLMYLLGGVFLIWQKVITWHTPVSVLGGLLIMSVLFSYDADTSTSISLHFLAGSTMLGAFFIATDPVSSATSNLGKLYYGVGIGVLIYVFRTWGPNPDGFAFAVLLMNFCAPFIDHYTRPRTYGQDKATRGYKA